MSLHCHCIFHCCAVLTSSPPDHGQGELTPPQEAPLPQPECHKTPEYRGWATRSRALTRARRSQPQPTQFGGKSAQRRSASSAAGAGGGGSSPSQRASTRRLLPLAHADACARSRGGRSVVLSFVRQVVAFFRAVAVALRSRRRCMRRRAGAPSAGLVMPPCSRRCDARPPLSVAAARSLGARGASCSAARALCVWLWGRSPSRVGLAPTLCCLGPRS